QLPRMPNLNWDELRRIADLGHEIGSHTVTHSNMAELDDMAARRELIESKSMLEAQLSRPVRWFAYPFGGRHDFGQDQLPLVREAGYDGVFSGFDGFVYRDDKNPIVPRDAVPQFDSLLNLELHLTGCLNWVYALKRRADLI